MIGLVFYTSMKSNLFEVRVVATEFFTYIFGVGATIRFVFDDNLKNWIIDGLVLFLVIFVGQKLVKSVHKEIEQREKIEKLAEELKQINVGQNSMIHFMNHQIKGRFGIAKNIFAELLSEDYGKMPEETVPLIKKGLEETDTGINYVQNILKGATAENGSLQYDKKPMNFKELVENVAKHQREKAEAKGLQFNLNIEEGDYNMVGDSLQLGEAVRNLMDNSINYTLQGSISVKLNFSLNNMKLQVIDTGVGITQEDMVNLFKAGGRGANSLKINVNSTGYGLVFVKNVVEAHGGKVWVESRGEGKGSTFSVELPKSN
jgi:signal transduction histidine kinase